MENDLIVGIIVKCEKCGELTIQLKEEGKLRCPCEEDEDDG